MAPGAPRGIDTPVKARHVGKRKAALSADKIKITREEGIL
jgi:hypothetical protein